MAIKFQYNKTSLQSLDKQLKMRVRALPTIKNKESALRSEVKKAKEEGTEVAEVMDYCRKNMEVQVKDNELENVAALKVAMKRLVKKYASTATVKKITPHKLRSTYGTTLYQETGDIYLVADVLGHKNVNTTRKHYAAMKEDNKRKAARIVQLREKE